MISPSLNSNIELCHWCRVAKDSSISKGLEINNESSTTKTFSINSSPVMRNLRNEVPLIHHVSPISPSYLEVMPVMTNKKSSPRHLKIGTSKLQL